MGDGEENASHGSQESRTGEFAQAYAAAVLAGDEVAAEIAIREAIDAKLSTAEVDEEIIIPALRLAGELWERGEISVADEHIATEISLRVLALLREVKRVAFGRRHHRVMLAAPSGELHVVALRMVGNLLIESGYSVTMIGADVPASALGECAKRLRPDAIGLSATMPEVADQLLSSVDAVRRGWPSAAVFVGGRALVAAAQLAAGDSYLRARL